MLKKQFFISKTIDVRGLKCPEPLTKTQQELTSMSEGILIVLVESPSNWNIQKYAKKQGMDVEIIKHKDHYEVKITKTPYSRPKENFLKRIIRDILKGNTGEVQTNKDVLLIVGTDTMGKEEAIGCVLMKGFFETMKVTKEIPHTIFFLNAGVKLTTTDKELIPILKEIEGMGVEIFSCGTCLKHFDLESELKVGYRGTTNHIIEGIKDFGKVVWI